MGKERLDEGIYEELYGVWQDMYRRSGDRAAAHLRWLGADPERLDEIAAHVDLRPVKEVPGLRLEEAAYCQGIDADMLRDAASDIREERGESEMEDPW